MRAVAATVLVLVVAAGGCAALQDLTGHGGAVPLVKAEGWRWHDEPALLGSPYAVVEVAFDRATAERAWSDNTPEGLPQRDGAPEEPGIYGDLDQVDFDEQVVVVWSSGESGSCPGWLGGLDTTPEGQVAVDRQEAVRGGGCTDDYNPYRMLLAVDRDRVPAADELPTEIVTGIPASPFGEPNGPVTAYPAEL